MDLNKDNRDVYTIDSEHYSEYMEETRKEPKDLLATIIQFLVVILLLVVVYFFFNILKNDLSFSEVFNKKELVSTYESLVDSDDKIHIVVEKEAKNVPEKIALVTEKKPNIVVVEQEDKPLIEKIKKIEEPKVSTIIAPTVVKKVEPIIKAPKIEEVIVQEKVLVVKEEPKTVEIVKVEAQPVEVIETKKVSEETELTESYLDRMVAELNSI